jgi:hypothetical protein
VSTLTVEAQTTFHGLAGDLLHVDLLDDRLYNKSQASLQLAGDTLHTNPYSVASKSRADPSNVV